MRLQDVLAPLVPSLGNIPFHGYRAFSNQVRQADEPFRFVDGELVEKFLGLSDEVQGSIVKGLGVGTGDLDVESVRAMVEGLRRLR